MRRGSGCGCVQPQSAVPQGCVHRWPWGFGCSCLMPAGGWADTLSPSTLACTTIALRACITAPWLKSSQAPIALLQAKRCARWNATMPQWKTYARRCACRLRMRRSVGDNAVLQFAC